MRPVILLATLPLLLAAPLAAAGPILPVGACSEATHTCGGELVCVTIGISTHCVRDPCTNTEPCSFDVSVGAWSIPVGVCTENHSPCAWDQLACAYTWGALGAHKVCVPDIS